MLIGEIRRLREVVRRRGNREGGRGLLPGDTDDDIFLWIGRRLGARVGGGGGWFHTMIWAFEGGIQAVVLAMQAGRTWFLTVNKQSFDVVFGGRIVCCLCIHRRG